MGELLYLGIACVLAAIVGGGLKMKGIEIPVVASYVRQGLLGVGGFTLISVSMSASSSAAAIQGLPSIDDNRQHLRLECGGFRAPDSPDLSAAHCAVETSKGLGDEGQLFTCFSDQQDCERIVAANNAEEHPCRYLECRANPGFYCFDYKQPEGPRTDCFDQLDRCLKRRTSVGTMEAKLTSDCEKRRLSVHDLTPLLLGVFGGILSLAWIWVGPRVRG